MNDGLKITGALAHLHVLIGQPFTSAWAGHAKLNVESMASAGNPWVGLAALSAPEMERGGQH